VYSLISSSHTFDGYNYLLLYPIVMRMMMVLMRMMITIMRMMMMMMMMMM